MKKIEEKNQGRDKKCVRHSCRNCPDCRPVHSEEKKPEMKGSLQLYAKEAESYFFYYAPQ